MFVGSRSIRGVGVFAFALLGSAVFAHTPEQHHTKPSRRGISNSKAAR
jgi:hypothetical protein